MHIPSTTKTKALQGKIRGRFGAATKIGGKRLSKDPEKEVIETLSCYTRHLTEIMAAAGVENSKESRNKIDHYLKEKYGMAQHMGSCAEVWKSHLKPMLANESKREKLIEEISKLFR